MGPTGSGKSAFINLASGSELHVGETLESCTDEVNATAPFEFEGRQVVLVDTPGFDDTDKSDTDILLMISEYLAQS
jgi:predicted GTPase